MAPAVLKDRDSRAFFRSPAGVVAELRREPRLSNSGNDRKRHRHLTGNCQLAVEAVARRRSVVVTPPQGSDPPFCSPAVELVCQIGPSRRRDRGGVTESYHLPIV